MSVELPPPVDLSLPPENPVALEDDVAVLAGAAFAAGVLAEQLAGPATSAPGWLGADAAAAAEQVTRTARLAREVHEALGGAASRLAAHAELVVTTVGRVRALQAAQREDFTALRLQLDGLSAFGAGLPLTGPAAAAIVERASEADRRRAVEHSALLAELTQDAADTVAVLAGAGRVVGASGGPGNGARVLRYLAAELPGWGDQQMAALGRGLAERLSGPATREQLESWAADAAAYLESPAFARALLLGLGRDGVRYLLTTAGETAAAEPGALAALLAGALHAVAPAGVAADADPLTDVLTGRYVDAHDPSTVPDQVIAGMGAVLLAAGTLTLPGAALAAWGRQMLARETVQGASAVTRLVRGGTPDPVVLVVDRLVAGNDPGGAAGLLSARSSWDALLHRSWDDGGAALSALVTCAGLEPGPVGSAAARSGLEALGVGLTKESGGLWTVEPGTAARIAAALGGAVAAHLDVVTDLLRVGLPLAVPTTGEDIALRGLGYLTADAQAALAVDQALVAWARQHVQVPAPGALPLTGAAAIGGYVAVREYGQRLVHALHGAQEQEKAADRAMNWLFFVSLPAALLRGLTGNVAGVLDGVGAQHFRADGTWDNGVDRGLVFRADDAAEEAESAVPAGYGAVAADQAAQAERAFDRTGRVLGTPRPPEPPAQDPVDTSDFPDLLRELLKPVTR